MAQHFGPENARLTIRTGRTGGAAKAGHDLLIEVGSWEATLDLEAQPALTLTADSRSFRVIEGTGGIKSLTDDDRASIRKTIDEEVLKGSPIEFRSGGVQPGPDGRRVVVDGDLELRGARRPVKFELALGEDRVSAEATIRQTEFGIKPYSTLFGALKVADEVRIAVEAQASL